MRAHQPGSTPIDIPETVPNPAYTPAPAPAPERVPTKVPEKVPEKIAFAPSGAVTGVTSQDGVTRAAFEAHKNRENAPFSGLNGPVTS